MEVILREHVDNLGRRGEVVKVADGYARNYLLPRKLALLATAYDPMYYLYTRRQAIRPALHRPATYFYPYGEAKPDVGTADEVKPQLEKLKVRYLILDPLDGFAEGKATIKLFENLVTAYGDRAKNVFTSTDGKHKIYALAAD